MSLSRKTLETSRRALDTALQEAERAVNTADTVARDARGHRDEVVRSIAEVDDALRALAEPEEARERDTERETESAALTAADSSDRTRVDSAAGATATGGVADSEGEPGPFASTAAARDGGSRDGVPGPGALRLAYGTPAPAVVPGRLPRIPLRRVPAERVPPLSIPLHDSAHGSARDGETRAEALGSAVNVLQDPGHGATGDAGATADATPDGVRGVASGAVTDGAGADATVRPTGGPWRSPGGAPPKWLLASRVLYDAPPGGLTRDELFGRLWRTLAVAPAERPEVRHAINKAIRRGLDGVKSLRRFDQGAGGRLRLTALGRAELEAAGIVAAVPEAVGRAPGTPGPRSASNHLDADGDAEDT